MRAPGDELMNINKIMNGIDGGSNRSQSSDSAQSSKDGATPSPVPKAEVQLSASSKSIQQIEAEIRQMSDVDDATVDRIPSALQSGQYQIDYEKLAGKMLDFEERLN